MLASSSPYGEGKPFQYRPQESQCCYSFDSDFASETFKFNSTV